MATKINPPDLSSGNYELYKEKLLAWQMVTDIPVDKQGIVIALTLPNDDKHKIQEEVFSQIGREKLSQENGLDTLINFLDSKLMKDDLSDSLEKFEEFEDFQRVNGQNITEYIAAFDSRYRKMEKFKIKLPSEILAFKLLRRANISKEEKMLVLTGMNYANRETLYEEAKQSLKKFKGDITEGSISTAASVKLEPAFLAENEEALLAAGYYKQGQGKRSVRTGRGGYSRGGGQRGQGQEARRKMNPTGPDGKPLTCRVCGSYRHLMKDCPDSWENIKKVNIVEDENVVLFTGYNKEEIYQLGVDARNCAILDSTCSSTVCGQNWMDSYINSLNEVDRKKIKQTTGERTFKFGGGTRLKSRAEYCLPAVIAGKEVTIKTDVVGSDIPLLLSRTAMKRAGVKMDLENDSATIFGKDIALNLTTSGHYCIPIDRTENIAVEEVFSVKLEEIERVNEILERHENGDAVQTEHKEGVVETNEEETEEESPVSEVIAAPVPAEDQNYEAPDRNSENQLSVTDQELQTVSSETATGSVENDRDTDRNTERSTRVKVNDNIRYKLGDEWVNGTIISRAGKASGKYKNWYNVRNENNDERSIDLERHEWQKIPETEINITETSSNKSLDSSEINIAKENELEKLAQFETYEEVADCGQKVLSTRWVITNKDGKTKARLVVRGFEERDLEIPRDSPTVGKGTMRLFISIAALENWAVKTTDIKSAFLQGKELERDIYIRPPKESQTPQGLIWKLKHGLYGLKDGARQFYESVREELMKLGFTQCRLDPALFYVHKDNRLRGIICCHVDDFLHAGDELFEALMEKLRGRFSAGKVEEKEFRYIGFKVKQYENRVILDHSEYIERMKNETIDPKRATDKKEILTTQEQKLYRQLVGQLNWAVQGSRPDMAFEMINMSTKLKQGTVENLVRVIKKISRMKDFHSYMTFPRLNKAAELKIVVFTDASLGNINEGTGSTGAYIVWLMDNTGQCCPIAWNAHKIKRVVRSTLAAETLGLEEGLEASYYYREMLASILGVKPRTVMIEAYVDNKSIIEAILSTRLVEDKRLRVDVAAIKESLQLHDVKKIQWVPGHLQLANPMTKQGASGFNLLKVLQSGKMLDELC